MGFLIPFLLGTIVGGTVTWQVDRRRQQGKSGLPITGWFWRKKNQSSSPAPQPSGTDRAEATPSAAEAADTSSPTASQPPPNA